MKKFLVPVTLLFAFIIAVGVLAQPRSDPSGASRPASSAGPADQATIQQDAAMTQRMSVPTASGPMETYQTVDDQLRHSQTPAFVHQLEQYQSQIDRMLARP